MKREKCFMRISDKKKEIEEYLEEFSKILEKDVSEFLKKAK